MKFDELHLQPGDKLVVTVDQAPLIDRPIFQRGLDEWRRTNSDLIIPPYITFTVIRGMTADTPLEVVYNDPAERVVEPGDLQ